MAEVEGFRRQEGRVAEMVMLHTGPTYLVRTGPRGRSKALHCSGVGKSKRNSQVVRCLVHTRHTEREPSSAALETEGAQREGK